MSRKTNRQLEEENAALCERLDAVADILDDQELTATGKLAEIGDLVLEDEGDGEDEEEEGE